MKSTSPRSTADLLRVVLGKQASNKLAQLSGLADLKAAEVSELVRRYGLTAEAAAKAVAVVELAYRIDQEPFRRGTTLRTPADVAAHARALGLADYPVERFHVLLLDAKNALLEDVLCSQGILTASLVHPREVFCPAIRGRASSIVLVHNHPSGDPEPSPEDLEITRRLQAVGELVGIQVADHIVVARDRYVSFRERGLVLR